MLMVFILLNILIPINASAEILSNVGFENISIDEGLSNEHVTSIFQDSKGYIWIGTKDGLNRYDGERIKIYNCSFKNKNTLSSTYITDKKEDYDGNIWIGTDHGLDFLLPDTDTVIRLKDIEDKYNLGDLKITAKQATDNTDSDLRTTDGSFNSAIYAVFRAFLDYVYLKCECA